MQKQTIKKLLTNVAAFYQTTADDFDKTRQSAWPGWKQLVPQLQLLEKQLGPLRVLDIGCGNGRFANFLDNKKIACKNYLGIDANSTLLRFAEQRHPNKTWLKVDLLTTLLEQQALPAPLTQPFDLIVGFGFLHHIPDRQLRHTFFSFVEQQLAPQGVAFFTAWQFVKTAQAQSKLVQPQTVGIDPQELDADDYILDWKAGERAFRYCHFLQEDEVRALLPPTLTIKKTFFSDGKNGQLNHYFILCKTDKA